ncbi:MAG: hypothetical protein WA705_06735 [Candidatus Ozemobacteraceae bacterium]
MTFLPYVKTKYFTVVGYYEGSPGILILQEIQMTKTSQDIS